FVLPKVQETPGVVAVRRFVAEQPGGHIPQIVDAQRERSGADDGQTKPMPAPGWFAPGNLTLLVQPASGSVGKDTHGHQSTPVFHTTQFTAVDHSFTTHVEEEPSPRPLSIPLTSILSQPGEEDIGYRLVRRA